MTIEISKLAAIMKLMEKHKVDVVEIEGIKITKGIHDVKAKRAPRSKKQDDNSPAFNYEAPEEILFKSSSAPPLSIDDLNNFNSGSN